ncbi:glycosyltransferase [Myxococcota bacterium]|nr:glycosyltransferase [Myxococcota bacterium]
MRRTVLCISSDPPPLPDHPASGGGLRIGALGAGLAAHGHRVLHAVDARALPAGAPEALRALAFTPGSLLETIARVSPDALLVEQWALASHLPDVDLPVAVDLHGSLTLENLFRRPESRLAPDLAAKVAALHRADHVLVPGERQRDWFSAFLVLAGHDPRRLPVSVVPLGLPEAPPPRATGGGPFRLVYGGARWPWIDSEAALLGAADGLEGDGDAALDVYLSTPGASLLGDVDGGESPWPRVEAALAGRARARVREALPHALYREALIREGTVALDVYRDNPERRLAITTRTVEYLWAGLPVIYARDGEMAREIEDAQAGWTVDPADRGGIAELVSELARSPRKVAARARNARRLFLDRHRAEAVVEPALPFFQDLPRRRRGPTALHEMTGARIALARAELDLVRRQAEEHRAAAQAAWDADRAEMQRRALDADRRLAVAEEEARVARAERDRLAVLAEDDLRAERARGERSEDEKRDLARRIQEQARTIEDLSRRDDAAREERQVLLREIDGLSRRVEGLQGEREGLLGERASLQSRVAEVCRERDEVAGQERVLREHLGNVERDLHEIQGTPAWRLAVRRARGQAGAPPPPGPVPPPEGGPGPAPPRGPEPEAPPPPVSGGAATRPLQRLGGAVGRAPGAAELIRLWVGEAKGNL